ncbi:tetratricopeptide repeat protein [Pedobacter chinensis]|uniref:Tetratricopeptide repeat protein n=1 Tax=Pedobacter chinensis TaxID=2282421 RepID=A0A369PZ00_9SPHI|nr:tetratricopeptide repeat protein [Pedobacter chinensis]RDC55929.1 tetratricopeptide repeat protein [Pedobacter chinensis]
MKQFFAILMLTFMALLTKAQTVQRERKVVQVMTPQTFYLNGRARGTLGGKSSTVFNITLPKNTVEWYYSFTTTKGEKPKVNIGLLSQLTRLYDPTGVTAVATNAIFTPSGAGVCDIYLMDKENCSKFMNTIDQLRGTYVHNSDGSRENYRDGTVYIKDVLEGSWCLGFRNPSATEGTSITFEVVAIVEENKVIEKTNNETKAETFAKLARTSYEKDEYDKSLELYSKAVELNPNLGNAYNDMGLIYLIKKDHISAIDRFAMAIMLFKKSDNPKYWFDEAINNLNALIARHGQLEGANDILEMLRSEAQR